MKFNKLKKIVAAVATFTCLMSQTFVYAATKTNEDVSEQNVAEEVNTEEGVVKVKIDDDGNLTYAEPQGAPIYEEANENSPFSWDNALVYFVLTDRFKNGDTSNDNSYGRGLNEAGTGPQTGLDYKTNPGTFHGGDLKGLTEKIEDGYFTDLGVNAIWITAPYEQIHGFTSGHNKGDNGQAGEGGGFPYYAYHGYWALDFSNIDKNMGDEKDFENFVDAAHERGIRVVMDVVMNHTGYITIKDCLDLGMTDAIKEGASDYYYGDVDLLSGGKPESDTWYNVDSADWATKWWGPEFIRVNSEYKGYTYTQNGASETTTLCGLPDIKTESKTEIDIPPHLQIMWKAQGRYEKEVAELNQFFSKTGLAKTPRNYVVKWLTDWVREYGVDGFRCDTAKHVEIDSWVELKKQAKVALNEWRQNNPTKPGAKWTDDFWMTGESWGHGVGKDYYWTSGAFDSMINFTFPKGFSSTSALEGTFAGYASQINSDPEFNVLSYISSHDDCMTRGDMISAGNGLLLTPGGAQIFYGDETNRPIAYDRFTGDYKDQRYRSDMNWDSIDQKVLSHWQKLGQFRYHHLSIGAGEHIKIADAPYTFGRVYSNAEKGVGDRVVVSIPGKAGACTVSVEGIFSDGAKLRDAYTDKMYTVSGGKVEVTAGENGVVLLEKGDKSPDVGVSPASKSYYVMDEGQGLQLTLSVTNNADATYSINGGKAVPFKNGDKITIGESDKYGETTTVTVYAKNSDGEAGPSTYTYTKLDASSMKVIVHAKNSKWTSAPNIYVYNEEGTEVTKYAGAWPGVAMQPDTERGEGWYKYELFGETSSARVIFNGSFGQDPAGTTSPGYLVEDEMVYEEGKWSTVVPVTSPKISSLSSNLSSPQKPNTTIKFTTAASGGTGTLKYQYEVNGSVKSAYSSTNTFSWRPTTAGTYTIKVTVKDDNGKTATKSVTYDIKNGTVLTLNSFTTSVASNQALGTTVKLKANATGTGTVKYRFTASLNGTTTQQSSWSTASSYAWKPTKAGTYTIKVEATDDSGSIKSSSKSFVIKSGSLAITSFKTSVASPQAVGKAITLSAAATGSGTVKYHFYVYSGTTLKAQSSLSTTKTYTWKPTAAGTYTLKVVATDSTGKVVSTTKTYKIVNSLKITSFTTSVASPQYTGTAITLKAAATGSGTVKYHFYVYLGTTLKAQSSLSTTKTYSWKPTVKGTYTIKVAATDSTGKIVTTSKSYVIKQKTGITIKSLTTSKASPQQAGTAITLTASATTTTGTQLQYAFSVHNGLMGWTNLKKYSTTNTVTWKPAASGTYTVWVQVKDAKGYSEIKTLSYVITDKIVNIEENNSKITCSSGWMTATSTAYSGGKCKYASTSGAKMSFKFTGTGIKIYGSKAPNRGMAKVTVDGKSQYVDFYNATEKNKQLVLSLTGLTSTTHTITIEVVGAGNLNSTGTVVAIDKFSILNGTIA